MYEYEIRIFSLKKYVNFVRMIKKLYSNDAPSFAIHFPAFRAICEYHASKNLALLLRTIYRAIFSHLRTNGQSDSVLRLIWMVHLGLPMIFMLGVIKTNPLSTPCKTTSLWRFLHSTNCSGAPSVVGNSHFILVHLVYKSYSYKFGTVILHFVLHR